MATVTVQLIARYCAQVPSISVNYNKFSWRQHLSLYLTFSYSWQHVNS